MRTFIRGETGDAVGSYTIGIRVIWILDGGLRRCHAWVSKA